MGLIHSYALWNNKGDVGKSTITFHLAMRYAELHPDEKVLVIDLWHQNTLRKITLAENGLRNVGLRQGFYHSFPYSPSPN